MNEFSADAALTPAAGHRVTLVCTVSGKSKARPALTSQAICERFSARIHEALGLAVERAANVPAGGKARWVRLEIRFLPRDRAEAAMVSQLRGKAIKHPSIAVQVMDKPLGLGEIDKLARLAGKTLAGN